MAFKHEIFEKNSITLLIGILIVVAIGGLVEIAPTFYLENTIEEVEGMRPYTPLELAGRNIYVREGCYTCHSQMVRSLRDEVERYGHYSLAAESIYDHPFQWGSKRTGPDLARVGGKYSDDWHREHMANPRALVPDSIMPGYPFLARTRLKLDDMGEHLAANAAVGVPYDAAMIANAAADIRGQLDPFAPENADFAQRYPGALARDFDGNPNMISELDAVIAYLQMLGTLVDFSTYEASAPQNLR